MNQLVLLLYIFAISGITLLALKLGRSYIVAWLALLAVAMNIFVLKQIHLFGFNVTASDGLAVGYVLGLNLIQEFFGPKSARECVWISLFVSIGFVILSQIHLLYSPSFYDTSQPHYTFLLKPIPRLMGASLLSFGCVQFLDLAFFKYLRKKMNGRLLMLRTFLSMVLSQSFDTLIVSFLALYGQVASIGDVIIFSLLIKVVAITLATPFVAFSKNLSPNKAHDI